MAKGQLDEYTLKARVFPAFLALMPLALVLGQFAGMKSMVLSACTGLGGATLLSFVLAQWSRDHGKRRESELWISWGGAPTTSYLRHRSKSQNPLLKERRKGKLAKLSSGLVLPTVRAEEADPNEADWYYEAITKELISRTRDRKKFDILFQENIAYGFRRNTWSLKPFAASFCATGMVGSILMAFANFNQNYNLVCSALCTITLFIWLLVVDSNWVRRSADIYADRLFASVDSMDELGS